MVPLHVLFGLLGLCSGAIALGIAKGSPLHRRSGQVFVVTMLLMTATGLTLAVLRANSMSRLNGIAATLTAYLVLTGYLAVRRTDRDVRWPDAVLSAVALCIAATSLLFGLGASAVHKGPPGPAFLVFGGVALLAFAGDIRKRLVGVAGARRLARHLWRVGAALWIATASFFLGQARVFPEPVRKPALLALPVLAVLVVVVYWFVRVRRPMKSSARHDVGIDRPAAGTAGD